jgi:hypothetical protein
MKGGSIENSAMKQVAESKVDKMLEKSRLHCKNGLAIFPTSGGMSLTKLSLAWKNLIIPGQGEFGKLHPGWGREN